jgi:hypothetical protein
MREQIARLVQHESRAVRIASRLETLRRTLPTEVEQAELLELLRRDGVVRRQGFLSKWDRAYKPGELSPVARRYGAIMPGAVGRNTRSATSRSLRA